MVKRVTKKDKTEPKLAKEDKKPQKKKEAKVLAAPGKNLSKVMDATQIYLSEIGFSPLLSAKEEVYYSKRALKGDEHLVAK